MRPSPLPSPPRPQLLAIAMLWLLLGSVMLLTTLIPAHTELLGWTPTFWLVGAPLVALLGLEPTLPRQLLALRGSRRRTARNAVWH